MAADLNALARNIAIELSWARKNKPAVAPPGPDNYAVGYIDGLQKALNMATGLGARLEERQS